MSFYAWTPGALGKRSSTPPTSFRPTGRPRYTPPPSEGESSVEGGNEDQSHPDEEDEDTARKPDARQRPERRGLEFDEHTEKPRKVLSLHAPNGAALAAAFYDPDTRKMLILEDTKDSLAWDHAISVIEQCRPAMIILSWQAQDSLLTRIDEYCAPDGNIRSELQMADTFAYANAVQHLSLLEIMGHQPAVVQREAASSTTGADEEEDDRLAHYRDDKDAYAGMGKARLSMVKLGCWINANVPLAMSAAGGLLHYLKTPKADTPLNADCSVEIDAIESMQLDQHMLINNDALLSLSIFDDERQKISRDDKASRALSVYSCLKYTVTPVGAKLLREWMLRPLVDLREITARHDAVAVFADANNLDTADSIRRTLTKVKNIPVMLSRLCKGRGGHPEWTGLLDAIFAITSVKEQIINIPGIRSLPFAREVQLMVTNAMTRLFNHASITIDFDSSKDNGKVCIRPGVDDVLDDLRQDWEGLIDILNTVAEQTRPVLDPRYKVNLTAVFFVQIGYLIAVQPLGSGFLAPKEWLLRFSSDDTMYFKNPNMERMDEQFGDIQGMIDGREIAIVQEMVEQLKSVEKQISHAMNVVAELDCLLAFARAVSAHHLVRPNMREEPDLIIRHGRHLLQEHWVERYISNDTVMRGGGGSEEHNMMIVTGANGSGKSAYGKQVALIVFLAQIGCFVPAESATIGIVDKIYTRMQTRESAGKDASAFMIDLAQVSLALRGATTRSLVVLDEFGKGTTPADGAGLLAGVIEYLINGACPRTIVLTHFHELFTEQFVDDNLPILHCHMKTELEESTKAVIYLYRLAPGKSTSSNAADCALKHGVPKRIVDRAKEVSEYIARYEIAKLHDTQLTDQDIAELQESEDLARLFFNWNIDENTQDVMEVLKNILEQTETLAEASERDDDAANQKDEVKLEPED